MLDAEAMRVEPVVQEPLEEGKIQVVVACEFVHTGAGPQLQVVAWK